MIIPNLLVVPYAILMFVLERRYPGRELPEAPGWYGRAILFNAVDIFVLAFTGWLLDDFFRAHSFFALREWGSPLPQLCVLFPAWSFVFYWWHRAAHLDGLWHFFHQMHHSPSRIEVVTTFYKHPLEAIWENLLTSFVLYIVFGASPEAGAWLGATVVFIGFFSHSNLKTPKWIGWFVQRPEQHSIHHQIDLHAHNYADFILWDRIFGTFKEAEHFSHACGFPNGNESRIREILRFKDVYHLKN